jgi:integrase
MAIFRPKFTAADGVHESPQIWIDFRYHGKRYRRPVASIDELGKKKAMVAATNALATIKSKIAAGTFDPADFDPKPDPPPPDPGTTFGAALKLYTECRTAAGKAERSYYMLSSYWSPLLADRPLKTITSEEIESALSNWTATRKWSPATRNNCLMQLSGLLSYAYGRRWIDAHPTERGRVPMLATDNARGRWLRVHEIEALRQASIRVADHPEVATGTRPWLREVFPDILTFAAATGMRLSEVCELREASYQEDDQGRAFVVTEKTKNGTRLTWPLEGDALAIVKARREGVKFAGAHLFGGARGGSPESSIKRWLPAVCRDAKLAYGIKAANGITFHTFRHTMASQAIAAGVPEITVQRMGNWKSASMTRRYAHLADESLRSAAATVAGIVGRGQRVVKVVRKRQRKSVSAIAVSA